jgi:broad specificity phosphatase PhoE
MIYLIRHGQTEYNLVRRYQGRLDSPLTALGVSQAQAIGRRLSDLLAAETPIVASPLGRTQATARQIKQAGGFTSPIATDPRLAEITLGSWDGLTAAQVDEAWPGLREAGPRHEWLFRSPDGETWEALNRRLGAWLADALAGPTPLIVVSHGVSGGVIRGLYAGLPRHETMSLDVPQDAFFRLAEGRIERIEVAGAATGA